VIGRTISHYKITDKLGEGGMGVVYGAEDLKLERTVALKFLAAHLVSDEEVRRRFEREAKAAAALDHPNICTVYEIGEADGQTFLAMAYVAGQTVKEKIESRPLELKEALAIAAQTAEGLEEAHRNEIVHRDIKPENLIVNKRDQVKIMDFGLAQLASRSKLTKTGSTLGTIAYMSPEQVQGEPTDHRTDIWSLGVVIYEMVTGRLPFKGDYEQVVGYNILNEEPEPVTALRAGLPMELEWIVGKALAKDQDERYQHVEDLLVDLRSLRRKSASGRPGLTPGGSGTRPIAARTPPGQSQGIAAEQVAPPRKARLHQVLFALAALVAVAVSVIHFRETPPRIPLRRFALQPPADAKDLSTAGRVSPNGKHVAFLADRKLWIRDLERQEPRSIEGTEGALIPFWSPGSDFVAFASGRELKKVPLDGGPVVRICEVEGGRFNGGSWSPDDLIVFGWGNPPVFYRVPAGGGAAEPLFSPEELDQITREAETGSPFPVSPHFLPPEAGPRTLVFTAYAAQPVMVVQNLESGERGVLGPGIAPFFSPSGHLLYQPTLYTTEIWALPFSLSTPRPTGDPFLVVPRGIRPTVSVDGTLVYGDGGGPPVRRMVWRNRRGEKTGEIAEAPGIVGPRLSPDGQRVVALAVEGSNQDIWVYDIERGSRTRVTTDLKRDLSPAWSPSGEQVAYSSDRTGEYDIHLRSADGTGKETVVASHPEREFVNDWSRDGNYLLYRRMTPGTRFDLWYLQRSEDGSQWEPHPFLRTPRLEQRARFSPDARFVAYESGDREAQPEVHVRSFPDGESTWQVSSNGGRHPRWSQDGKELFFVEGDSLMAASISTTPNFSVHNVRKLFDNPGLSKVWGYDVSADGERFVVVEHAGEKPKPAIRVVQNWYEEFRGREQD
jgi:serine/threonine-protein kinase